MIGSYVHILQVKSKAFANPFPYGTDFNFVKMQFDAADTDKSGKLDLEEFRRLLPFMGMACVCVCVCVCVSVVECSTDGAFDLQSHASLRAQSHVTAPGLVIPDGEARAMFDGADSNNDKHLDFNEFYVLMSGTCVCCTRQLSCRSPVLYFRSFHFTTALLLGFH